TSLSTRFLGQPRLMKPTFGMAFSSDKEAILTHAICRSEDRPAKRCLRAYVRSDAMAWALIPRKLLVTRVASFNAMRSWCADRACCGSAETNVFPPESL